MRYLSASSLPVTGAGPMAGLAAAGISGTLQTVYIILIAAVLITVLTTGRTLAQRASSEWRSSDKS